MPSATITRTWNRPKGRASSRAGTLVSSTFCATAVLLMLSPPLVAATNAEADEWLRFHCVVPPSSAEATKLGARPWIASLTLITMS